MRAARHVVTAEAAEAAAAGIDPGGGSPSDPSVPHPAVHGPAPALSLEPARPAKGRTVPCTRSFPKPPAPPSPSPSPP